MLLKKVKSTNYKTLVLLTGQVIQWKIMSSIYTLKLLNLKKDMLLNFSATSLLTLKKNLSEVNSKQKSFLTSQDLKDLLNLALALLLSKMLNKQKSLVPLNGTLQLISKLTRIQLPTKKLYKN